MARMTWLRRRVRWVVLGLIVTTGLGTLAGTLIGAPAFASEASGVSSMTLNTGPLHKPR